uniref:Reverse transcriptase domain-containing protein n=1 Tax=Cannabis sativa TaxID=3483 RepID=A0A803QEL1_CANSA
MVVLGSLAPSPILPTISASSSSILSRTQKSFLTRRRTLLLGQSLLAASLLHLLDPIHSPAIALQQQDELQLEEDRIETSPSVVFIKDIEIDKNLNTSEKEEVLLKEDNSTKIEGTGSGFIWDKFGHIVTNYHVVSKLITDTTGLQRCKVYLVDEKGNGFYREGKIVGYDPAYDLAVLKVDVEGYEIKPVAVGNSGGPLIDSYGHVIGVNTATFTRKGTGVSSGVNFAIPVDTVVRTVPYLIVYGTPYSNRAICYYFSKTILNFCYGEEAKVLGFSINHIDVNIHSHDKPVWRLTGCYGEPNRNNRDKTWNLLRELAGKYDLPWCVIGDLNNVANQDDKRGGNSYPEWLINGFNGALAECNLYDFDLTGYPYTWEKGTGTPNWIEIRLDRALMNQRWMDLFTSAKLFNLEWSSSDHCPILLVPFTEDYTAAKKSFRFENAWLREPICTQIVRDAWEFCLSGSIIDKIKQCSLVLAEWGKDYTGNFKERISNLKAEIRKWRNSRDLNSIEKFKDAEAKLFEVYTQREVFWKQRSKQLWLREGDQNSKYFHAYATSRKKHNSVTKLKDAQGNWIDWKNGLSDVILNYYNDLFCSSATNTSPVTINIPSTVTRAQNESLLAPVSNEEVRKALFQMHPDKSPGPDGMTPGFYQRCWSIVGSDIINLVRSFMRTGDLPQGLNDTNLVLIPKVKSPSSMNELRPISLCNVVYKIISKVIANRLKEVLPQLISTNQSAFVPGRLITDNIMISYEVMHYLKRKRRGKEGFMALSLDFSKAYDRVEWQFLKDMMCRMGFDHHWIHLILSCVSSVRYKIVNSGREMGPIVPSRGIRQGDPLSSYLFLICAEGFSALIKSFESAGYIRGCRVTNGAPVISHMLFADDSYIYCRANEREASNVIRLLKMFEEASGQIVNFNKSSIFYSSNTSIVTKQRIGHLMHIKEADGTSLYLGLPSLVGRNKKAILGFIKDKLQKRIQHWEGRFLSKAGKETLLKTVAQAFPSYAMSVFLLPLETCRSLEGVMSSFWWKSSKYKHGVSWHSWKKLCKHKAVGGLGFRDFREYNLALLGKQAWRLLTETDSLVCKIYKARYFPDDTFLNASLGHNPSFIWKSIFDSKALIVADARISIGNGLKTNITNTPWLPDMHHPYVTTSHPTLDVNHVSSLMQIDNLSWDVDVVNDLFNERDCAIILGIPLPQTNKEDYWSWKFENSGYYSVKSAYRYLNYNDEDSLLAGDFWKSYWKIKSSRNDVLWKGRVKTAANVVLEAKSYLNQWLHAQKNRSASILTDTSQGMEIEHWTKPVIDTIKVNVDGAIFANLNSYGVGFIARNSDGRILEAGSKLSFGNVSPEIAEIYGIKEALSWIKSNNWHNVSLETDSLLAVQGISSTAQMPSTFGMVAWDCKRLLSELTSISLKFVKRTANKAAHFLARSACYSPVRIFSHDNSPYELLSIVMADSLY